MGGGGSNGVGGAKSASDQVDQASFQKFMQSETGSKLSQGGVGQSVLDNARSDRLFQQTSGVYTIGTGAQAQDVNTIMNAYIAWKSDQNNVASTWDSYARAVNQSGTANSGGTILGSVGAPGPQTAMGKAGVKL